MPVTYKPLKSDYGFQSPNFFVSELGVLTVSTINVNTIQSQSTSGFSIENFIFNNSTIDVEDHGTIEFLNDLTEFTEASIIDASIDNLTINTSLITPTISNTDTIELDATDRIVILSSPLQVKSYTELERDDLTAELGDIIFNSDENEINFYNGSWKSTSTGTLSFSGSTISAENNQDITIDPQGTGTVIVNELQINNDPIENNQAVRKSYVDTRISAFAIAFGV